MHHIIDPLYQEPQKQEVVDAVADILEIAKECPPGFGLEMGLYWSLFMAGITNFNDEISEDLIRQKLLADTSLSIYVSGTGNTSTTTDNFVACRQGFGVT